MKRVSEIVTTDKIRKWNDGDIITIKAGTGVGKSYFIKNNLYAFAKSNNKKILMLLHRTNCVNQFIEEIKSDKKTDVIDIRTYQSLESIYKNNKKFDFSQYGYIVCDEFHYFMSDAGFNKTTDISLNAILNQNDKIRIFTSATGDYMKAFINKYKKIETIDYELPIDFNFIKELTFFNKDETLEKFIEEAIEKNTKGIFFIQSAKKAFELHNKYKEHTIFNCSKSNDDYYKYVNKDKIDSILKNEKFDELILITTTCMDAGVNIKDPDLQHVVCDVKDIGTLIQCIGRKRIQNKNDKIYLYIKTIDNKQLGGMESQRKKKIEMAEYLRKNTVEDYIKKYSRELDYSHIVYDDTVGEEDKGTKKVNDLMFFKCKIDMRDISYMKKYGEYGYCKYISKKFEINDYRTIQEDYARNELEDYLEGIVGSVILQTRDRKELIEKINVRQNGKLLKSLDSLNSALREQNIYFYIESFSTSRVIKGKKKNFKSAWRVMRLADK